MEASAFDGEGRRKYLNQAENRRFLATTVSLSQPHESLCLTMYYTGCRISEALNLEKSSIDLEAQSLVILTLKKRNRRQYRRVPVPPGLIKKLIEQSHKSESEKLWNYCRSGAWHIVKRVMGNAKVSGPQATAKGLRHGFGVRCAMNHIPVSKIREWMGHSDTSTTEIYLNIREDEERELIERTW